LELLGEVNSRVGCRVVRLDCRDALIGYYERNGFMKVGRNDERNLNQMVRIIK